MKKIVFALIGAVVMLSSSAAHAGPGDVAFMVVDSLDRLGAFKATKSFGNAVADLFASKSSKVSEQKSAPQTEEEISSNVDPSVDPQTIELARILMDRI